MNTCIYCGREKPVSDFSLEHVWPEALGGALASELFKTRRVCQRCNNLCGLWVDGAFLKSWFVQNELALSAERFLDPDGPGIIPLTYFGPQANFPVEEGDVCERWNGPCGERIYHIHLADDARWDTQAGGDVIRRKVNDPGRAYIQLTSPEEYWWLVALLSFASHFPRAKRCCLTSADGGQS